ncbi:hypothetical protein PR003_g34469 [Phytophthora rubi]|uniref:Uncharacterized protein n=1 Tax=Phytophthora rubi TaxID=129364 RepID=A0A6A4AQ37_9STRA|nr:hypothetical protein PR003_g34469 [Phytophthora rubi]
MYRCNHTVRVSRALTSKLILQLFVDPSSASPPSDQASMRLSNTLVVVGLCGRPSCQRARVV